MNLLELVPGISQIIDRVVPDPRQKEQLKFEMEKVRADEVKARMGVLRGLLSNKSMFVAGAIPALIWLAVLALINNYILMPWVGVFGGNAPPVNLPQQYWSLLTIIITGLFGKKVVDGNEIRWPNGNLMTPKKEKKEEVAIDPETPPPRSTRVKRSPEEIQKELKALDQELRE